MAVLSGQRDIGEPLTDLRRVGRDRRCGAHSVRLSGPRPSGGTTPKLARPPAGWASRGRRDPYHRRITAPPSDSSSADLGRQLGLVRDVGIALTRAAPLVEQLDEDARAIVVHLDAAFARIWTLRPGETVLKLQASAGRYTHLDGGHSEVPVGMFKIGLIAAEREAHLTNDVANDPRVSDHELTSRPSSPATRSD